ncbi:MAG: extradiol ring-cleavage dioxygenase [Gaiellaceae bacterium]
MSLVFAAIAPHGTLAVPDAPDAAVAGSERTQAAMRELGRRFDAARPEVTIVLTPHNVHVDGHFAVVLAGSLYGDLALWDAPSVQLECPVDLELAMQTVVSLHDDGIPVVGVSFGANDPGAASAPLDWGALIPLWVMGGRSEPPVPAVVMSPARDRPFDEHVRAGAALAAAAGRSGRRVALIASADHGHAHDADGPYGYDPASKEYDDRVVDIVGRDELAELLALDGGFVEQAKADSFWQMLMLHGALGDGWTGELLSYEAPTYFGMLCAAYAPK